jgi:transposase
MKLVPRAWFTNISILIKDTVGQSKESVFGLVPVHAASVLEISLEPLPAYSPDFMPVEHLWQWLRADVTYHTCYNSKAELIEQVSQFQQQINASPIHLADRLWVKTHLDPEEEKLRVSI